MNKIKLLLNSELFFQRKKQTNRKKITLIDCTKKITNEIYNIAGVLAYWAAKNKIFIYAE